MLQRKSEIKNLICITYLMSNKASKHLLKHKETQKHLSPYYESMKLTCKNDIKKIQIWFYNRSRKSKTWFTLHTCLYLVFTYLIKASKYLFKQRPETPIPILWKYKKIQSWFYNRSRKSKSWFTLPSKCSKDNSPSRYFDIF